MALSPGGAKQKGAEGERELARLLLGWSLPSGLQLKLARNLEQTRGGGHDLTGLEQFGMAVEVKRVEDPAITSWWGQACRQAKKAGGLIPVLAHRRNRQPWRFRVRVFVWPCGEHLDVDMEAEQFRKWFVAQLGACHPKDESLS